MMSNDELKKALADCHGAERKKLYHALLENFTIADANHDGSVDPSEFGKMIDAAAAASLINKPAEDIKALFSKMDENNDGQISLDEWLGFCFKQIAEKIK